MGGCLLVCELPDGRHGEIEACVVGALSTYLIRDGTCGAWSARERLVCGDIGFTRSRDPDSSRAPDAAYISRDRCEGTIPGSRSPCRSLCLGTGRVRSVERSSRLRRIEWQRVDERATHDDATRSRAGRPPCAARARRARHAMSGEGSRSPTGKRGLAGSRTRLDQRDRGDACGRPIGCR